jgi:hypothetical protein
VSKAGARPNEAPFRQSPLGQAPGLALQILVSPGKLDRDKCSSLLGFTISDEEYKFYTIKSGLNLIKLSFFDFDETANKLESFTPASPFNLCE